jgi:hypothetical protein
MPNGANASKYVETAETPAALHETIAQAAGLGFRQLALQDIHPRKPVATMISPLAKILERAHPRNDAPVKNDTP